MTYRTCLRAVLLSGLAFAMSAQDAAQTTPAPSAPPAWSAGPIDFSGLIDGYYSLNLNHPASRNNVVRNFDVRANSFSLNMAKFTAEHTPDPIGFRADFGFGRAFDIFHATEPLKGGSDVMRHLMQAYVSVKPEKGKGFQFDFGKFYTSAGAELTETHLNYNYSRALLYANGPYYHFGARMTKPITPFWTAGVQVVNGWNNVEDNNSGKTFGFTSALTGKKASLFNNYYVGPEKAQGVKGNRHFFDTVINLNPTDKTSFYINLDVGSDKNRIAGNNDWWGIGFAGRFQVHELFALSPRYEYYDDKNGFITGTPQHLQEFTMTAEMKLKKGFVSRLEYRRDWSNQPFFDRGNGTANHKTQDTVLLGFVVFFGPK
ncbi:MAG: porin [Acidobacteria bacterium]|nr:porin [Acidobacteriota bacterium]